MVKKQTAHIIKGMQKDVSVSKQPSEYAIDAKNIRITNRENSTLFSITNEKGTDNGVELTINDSTLGTIPLGTILGTVNIKNNIVIFAYNEQLKTNIIGLYILEYHHFYQLYRGDLNISTNIEALVSVENEDLIKIYWVDGINLPRVMILNKGNSPRQPYVCANPDKFEFNQPLQLKETISVIKNYTGGNFAPGTIQYTFNYYNYNGQETPLVETTSLYYISLIDRGAAPDEQVSNSFKININNIDTNFDYLRIYSIHRTSINAVPTVKILTDVKINNTTEISYTDGGDTGEIIDPTELLYKGGEYIIPSTLEQKDGTLFFGNIKIQSSPQNLQSAIISLVNNGNITIREEHLKELPLPKEGAYSYSYYNQLGKSLSDISTFKYLDWYRLGIQFQDKYGHWSNPIFLKDFKNELPIDTKSINSEEVRLPGIKGTLNLESIKRDISRAEYVKVRPIIVYPSIEDRDVLCQGVLCPTVYNLYDRVMDNITSQSSWFCRPNAPYKEIEDTKEFNTTLGTDTTSNSFLYTEDNTKAVSKLSIMSNTPIHYFSNDEDSEQEIKEEDIAGTYKIHDCNLHEMGDTVKKEDFSSSNFTIVKENDNYYLTSFMGADVAACNKGGLILEKEEEEDTSYKYIILTIPYKSTIKVLSNGSRYVIIGRDTDNESSARITLKSKKSNSGTASNTLSSFELHLIEERASDDLPFINYLLMNSNATISKLDNQTGTLSQNFSRFGKYARFRHNDCLGQYSDDYDFAENVEIQGGNASSIIMEDSYNFEDDKDNAKSAYYVNQNIVTLHSPEIEFETISNIKDYKLRLIGIVPITANSTKLDIKDITKNNSAEKATLLDFVISTKNKFTSSYSNKKKYATANMAWKGLICGPWYYSKWLKPSSNTSREGGSMIYPWQCRSSISPYGSNLFNKIIYNSKFSNNTYYLNSTNLNDNKDKNIYEVSDIGIWNKNSTSKLTLTAPSNFPKSTIKYSGDILDYVIFLKDSAPKNAVYSDSTDWEDIFISTNFNTFTIDNPEIHMNYKSSNHIVIPLSSKELNKITILPAINGTGDGDKRFNGFKWDISKTITGYTQTNISIDFINWDDFDSNLNYGWLWLGELYKDNSVNRFGGNYEQANNLWYPAGVSVEIPSDGNVEIQWTTGDTFYQRYDHVKTFPVSTDKDNSILEIISFMCETRVNIDGRYDRNRGADNIYIQDNFNLHNEVYNQKDTFFNYRKINEALLNNTKFPYTVVWSKQKFPNSEIDPWTSINTVSSINLEGLYGDIVKLESFNNEIYAFQNESINHILFNTRIQIPVSEGVPIEIGNSYKVDGFKQVSSIGSDNPLAIQTTPKGIYYMNDIYKGIYIFNGEQSISLSDSLGMSYWVRKQDIGSYKINYDKVNQDVYFINENTCLGYSEKLAQFESFYDYEDSLLFNVKDKTLAIKDSKIYELFSGDYNKFFGNVKDFYITFTHNENPYNDKVYESLEFSADTYNENTLDNLAFNEIRVWNEYQDTRTVSLNYSKYNPSNLKRKFRIWRANIPRDWSNNRDKIRNTWSNITLKACNPSDTRTELHNLIVNYYM